MKTKLDFLALDDGDVMANITSADGVSGVRIPRAEWRQIVERMANPLPDSEQPNSGALPWFTRGELLKLFQRAMALCVALRPGNVWHRAYEELAYAADKLDAIVARAQLQNSLAPPKQPTTKSK